MWYKEKEEILKQLETSSKGITNLEANKRLKKEGLNRIPTGKKNTIWNIIMEQLKNPIIFILFFSAIFSIITKSTADAIFIFVVIGINTIIGTYQEWSSEKSAEKLQNMIKIRTKVLRDGKIEIVDALIEVYNSFISSQIDDYNSSVYYENPNYIFECYKQKKML